MFTPEVTEAIPIALEQIFDSLQMSIMTEIVRMLLEAAEIIPSTGYKMSRLYDLGTSKKRIKDIVARTLNLSNKEVENIFTNITESGYNEAENAFTEQGKEFIPYSENEPLQQFVRAVQEQTQNECKNITQSMGFAKRQPDGSLGFTPVADYYQETLDKAVTEIASGASDYNTVLEKTVTEMTNSGLRTVDYASGHSNRVTVAARRAVSTGLNQVVGKINEGNAEKLGTNYFEVSWHSGARPSHQVWQGRVYSKEELESVCGLGTVTGLCGANCYHSYSPFTPGITPRTYTDEQLDKMNAEENKPVEYNGKTYTKYEATQRQRRFETAMRAQRQKIKLLEEGEADEQAIINARARYVKTSDEYVNFSKSVGLSQQWDRVTVGGSSVEGLRHLCKIHMVVPFHKRCVPVVIWDIILCQCLFLFFTQGAALLLHHAARRHENRSEVFPGRLQIKRDKCQRAYAGIPSADHRRHHHHPILLIHISFPVHGFKCLMHGKQLLGSIGGIPPIA